MKIQKIQIYSKGSFLKSPNIDRLKLDSIDFDNNSSQSGDSPKRKTLNSPKRRVSKMIKLDRNSISNSPRRKSIRENSTSSKRSSLAPTSRKSTFVKSDGSKRNSLKKISSKTQLGKPAKMSRF